LSLIFAENLGLGSGNTMIAVVNTDILNWENKASHPWVLTIDITYEGEGQNGMPDNITYQFLDEVENKVLDQLKDYDGYLNIGRQTADNVRTIFFVCKDFRKPSKVAHQLTVDYANTIPITYEIYKDKYWRSFDRFKPGS
jgi:hypothetical protein